MIMRRRTPTIALLLLLSFATGAVLAPVSHYAFMAFSDAYLPMHEAGTMDHGHHAMPSAMATAGPQVGIPVDGHVGCDYADLFATFVLDAPPTATSVPHDFAPTIATQVADQVTQHTQVATDAIRGPPVA